MDFAICQSFCCLETIHSQTVKGQVTSAEDHEPLIGASIMISNTGKGTVTDVDGVCFDRPVSRR